MDILDNLERGREACARRAWHEAYRFLKDADEAAPLDPGDVERLATAAYLLGGDGEYVELLDRAHRAYLDAGERVAAARCAFWSGLALLFRGETGRASGWLARSQRLLEGRDCVEQGYLLLPEAERELAAGNSQAAHDTAAKAASMGERFSDDDLVACARHQQGRALLKQAQMRTGLALLDEAMVAVVAGELSPIVTGLIYCSVIEACQQVYALDRAREWTSALAKWCEAQPEMEAFTATCLVHRAEIMQLHGAWPDAIEEAGRACRRRSPDSDLAPPASAYYQQAEVHRLRGNFEAAEAAYRAASQGGFEPQPGLALLRLAQGRSEAACAGIRRVAGATSDRFERARLLPACIEILLAAGERREAGEAARELEAIAQSLDIDALTAMAAHARGAVALAEGDAGSALGPLRAACEAWQRLKMPYAAARTRMLIGLACRAAGDGDGAEMALAAARTTFKKLGAAPDLARLDALTQPAPSQPSRGLSSRELQVLRLVATGKTNKAIARELVLSEKTIDRHVSNIFTKLDVSSRAAATACAYQNGLI